MGQFFSQFVWEPQGSGGGISGICQPTSAGSPMSCHAVTYAKAWCAASLWVCVHSTISFPFGDLKVTTGVQGTPAEAEMG